VGLVEDGSMELWFLLSLALGGLVVGGLGRLAVPGPDPMPWWATILLGIGGMLLGGLVSVTFLHAGYSLILAVISAALLLIAYRKLVQKRPLTGPDARRLP
jgi:uncharacterized membrane protein YeaQ/YmgE (transglycosylase-associated protein family)